jgi:cytochrome c oxidase subunit 2
MSRRSLSAGVLAVFAMAAAASTMSRGAGAVPSQRESDPVEIVAERFSFTPSEIKTKVNTKLTLRLRSEDTDHGFRLVGTSIDVRIPKRGRGHVDVVFEPTKEGKYTFECSHVCGAGHPFMRGTIVVSK